MKFDPEESEETWQLAIMVCIALACIPLDWAFKVISIVYEDLTNREL